MINGIMKSVTILVIIASFISVGFLLTIPFTVHAITYGVLAIFDLSLSIIFLLATLFYIYFIYWIFSRNNIQKLDKKGRISICLLGIILPILAVFPLLDGKPYILDLPNAISKKYVTLKNAEIIKANFHQGTGRAAALSTYYDVLVKEANGKQITLEVYTNFAIIRGTRTLTNYNISYLPHSKEIVSVSLSKNQKSTATISTVQSSQQTESIQKQDYPSKLNMILTDYHKVRNEYSGYRTQYSTKTITASKYRDLIGSLMSPLNSDSNQGKYLEEFGPQNTLAMTRNLTISVTDFYGYINILHDSLKTSNQTEASEAQVYLTNSDQAFQEFNVLYQTYISNK